jgi:acyl-CoA synthetase (AMP-forming)/AMP-acid ligase II
MSDTTDSPRLLWAGFLRSCEQFPTRGAIDFAGRELTYQQLAYLAKRLAATLQAGAVPGAVLLTAVFATVHDLIDATYDRLEVTSP